MASNRINRPIEEPLSELEFMIAEHDVTGQDGDELSFQVGQVIRVISKITDNTKWWIGETNGLTGLFPHQFCKAVYETTRAYTPFKATYSDELSLLPGDIIHVLRRQSGLPGWNWGRLNGREGIFPANHCSLLPLGQLFCAVCTSTVPANEMVGFRKDCLHSLTCCKPCLTLHLRLLIDPVAAEDLNELLTNRLLDGMEDIRRCPLCQYPVIWDESCLGSGGRDILCPVENCHTSYCSKCKGKSHGDQPCRTAEENRELYDQFVNGTPDQKEQLIKKHGQDTVDDAFKEVASEDYIKAHTKPCPGCKRPLQKNGGCNRMFCIKCSAYSCNLCGVRLADQDPYAHFKIGTCKLFAV
ncbi:putative E3 ubiquitin-protein ligase RNF14 [Hypsibius exemplaris]|uniref:E3 ubiquitin-protein ligase RNF14 n=1 Tax=Hypsibius exemplaris TaxID=2072580 RepID=A0A9X6NKC8_HYPEX|nr:putative E3 ubiquitin-protein ligase RNF14 [Hypsibius exemplaris]